MAQLGCNIGRRYIQATVLTVDLSTAKRGLTKSPSRFGTRLYCSGTHGDTTASYKSKNLLHAKKKTAERELLNILGAKFVTPEKCAERLNNRIIMTEKGLLDTLNAKLDLLQKETTEPDSLETAEPTTELDSLHNETAELEQSEEGITLKKLKEELDLQHEKIEELDFQHKKIAEQEMLLQNLNVRLDTSVKRMNFAGVEFPWQMSERLDSQQKVIAAQSEQLKFQQEKIAEHEWLLKTLNEKIKNLGIAEEELPMKIDMNAQDSNDSPEKKTTESEIADINTLKDECKDSIKIEHKKRRAKTSS